jgi:protein-L-isoaspartate(D-aspartate) O-methyltransferase
MNAHIETARQQMVTQQVRAWSVLDPAILEVMSSVPRERFVPARYESLAFADTAIPLPGQQRMFTPQVEGRILQVLQIRPGDEILEIGTGSGFLTACLGRLGARVLSLEIRADLAAAARRTLGDLGLRNCEVKVQDVFAWQPPRGFDCIVVGGSLPVPDARFEQWLNPGGRLFAVIGAEPAMEAWLVRRSADGAGWQRESLFETALPALDHAPGPERFQF